MKTKKRITISIIILILFAILVFTDIYACPIRHIFGIPCPLCGMTRAITLALSLNFKEAFFYHLFWPLVIIIIIIHILVEFNIIKLKTKKYFIPLLIITSLNLIYYITRIITKSPITKIDFKNSLLFKMFKFITNIIV